MGKSKTKQTSSGKQATTQTATPFQQIIPGMQQLGTNIGTAMGQAQAVPLYMGDMVAQAGDRQRAVLPSMQGTADYARSLSPLAMNAANQALSDQPTFEGPGLEAGTGSFANYDPSGVQSVIQAAIQPYMRQLTEQVLPGMQSSALESGAYGNDRAMSIMPGQALRDTGRMAAEVGSGIAYQDFADQQRRSLEAYGLGTQRGLGEADVLTQRLSMYPDLLNSSLGFQSAGTAMDQEAANYDVAMRQAEINNAMARDQYMVNAPFRGLDTAAQLYGSFAPYATQQMNGTNSSTSTTTQQQALGPQLLQAAMGIGSAAMGMPGGLGGLFGGAAASAANPMMGMASSGSAFSNPANPFSVLNPNFGR